MPPGILGALERRAATPLTLSLSEKVAICVSVVLCTSRAVGGTMTVGKALSVGDRSNLGDELLGQYSAWETESIWLWNVCWIRQRKVKG